MRRSLTLLPLLAACAGDPSTDTRDTTDTAEATPRTHRFSFVVIADPHVTRAGANLDRLDDAVAWITANADARAIALVVIVGDIAWADGIPLVIERLDTLPIPWAPVIGDNVIQVGEENDFETLYTPVYEDLALRLDDWERAPSAVHDAVNDRTVWLQNFRFTHEGVRFVGLDWCTRRLDRGLVGEMADLHDFDGGTLPFLRSTLADAPTADGSVLLFSHHPMHISPGALDGAEIGAIAEATAPHAAQVATAFAGHYHIESTLRVEEAGYDVAIIDALHDDLPRMRLVEVWSDDATFTYEHETLTVP